MFPFDKSKFRVVNCGLMSISKSTIDPRVALVLDGGEKVKLSVPVAVARNIKNRLKGTTKFSTAYPCSIAFVGDHLVAMDVPTGADYKMYQDLGEWFSSIDKKKGILEKVDETWMFDGQYVYRQVGEIERLGTTNFGSVAMQVINLYKLGEEKADLVERLASLTYFNEESGEWVVTSPVTRQSGAFIQLTGDVDEFQARDQFIEGEQGLDRLNLLMFPNLRFVNYAAKVLSDRFGYEMIEPLGLPLLMIEHLSFNLGSLPTAVQISSPAPFKFTQALAWMVGMHRHVKSLDDLIAVKSSLKMLLSKGNTLAVVKGEGAAVDDEVDTKALIQSARARFEAMPLIKFE